MSRIDLLATAAALPDAWRSTVVARVGGANLKVVRMDAAAYAEEVHDYPEALLVLDGLMRLALPDGAVEVGAGQVYVVPPGIAHGVAPGSHGTLLIFDI